MKTDKPASAGRDAVPSVGRDVFDLGKLPWHRSVTRAFLSSGVGLMGIASDDNMNVVWVSAALPSASERLDFIVNAINSHDDLLEALKEIEIICTESAGDCRRRMGTRVGNALTLARAAIAKASPTTKGK